MRRQVHTLRVKASAHDHVTRFQTRFEDAFRTASLPLRRGEVWLVRSLNLGVLPDDVNATALSKHIEHCFWQLAPYTVRFDHRDAPVALAVHAPSMAAVLLAAFEAVATGQTLTGWFWPKLIASWNAQASMQQQMQMIVSAALSQSEGAQAIMTALSQLALVHDVVVELVFAMRDVAAHHESWSMTSSDDIESLWVALIGGERVFVRRDAYVSMRAQVVAMLSRGDGPHVSSWVWLMRNPVVALSDILTWSRVVFSKQVVRFAPSQWVQIVVEALLDPVVWRTYNDMMHAFALIRGLPMPPEVTTSFDTVNGNSVSDPRASVVQVNNDAQILTLTPTREGWVHLEGGGVLFLWHILRALGMARVLAQHNALWAWQLPRRVILACAQMHSPDDLPVWMEIWGQEEPWCTHIESAYCAPALWWDEIADVPRVLTQTPGHPVLLGDADGVLLAASHKVEAHWPRSSTQVDSAEQLVHAWVLAIQWWLAQYTELSLAALICRPGKLWRSETHMVIRFGFDDADIRVRRMGLDTDLSWVPSLEHVIAFEYRDDHTTPWG